jgi:thermitase
MIKRISGYKVWTPVLVFASLLVSLEAISGPTVPSLPKNFPEESFVPGQLYVDNEILVKFKPSVSPLGIRSLLTSYRLQPLEKIPRIGVHRLKTRDRQSFEKTLADLKQIPSVEYAEPNYIPSLADVPNDPYFLYQWTMQNTGQTVGPLERYPFSHGRPGHDISAVLAWDLSTGREMTKVGVVDIGLDLGHPDLIHNILSSGRNFFDPQETAQDDHGHGTHVSGTIAAEGNNGIGVSGVCWKAKVFDNNVRGPTSSVINGIIYVTNQGVRVINMSLGGGTLS